MSFQEGHRQRLKQRFRQEGLDHFEERYVLELMLFYCVPRQDTKELACRLLEHFGSIVEVLEASAQELERVPGVGEGISTFLSFRRELERYYQIRKAARKEVILRDTEEYGEYLRYYFKDKKNEEVYALCLDAKCMVLSCKQMGEGSVNSANVPVRRIVELALSSNASSVILAHNHPSGLALPSNEDIQTTYRLANALQSVDVQLVDHLIYTESDYTSIAQSGYMKNIRNRI